MVYPCCDVTKALLMMLKINPRWRQIKYSVKGHWQRKFLLAILKVLRELIMDMIIIRYQNPLFMSYVRFKF